MNFPSKGYSRLYLIRRASNVERRKLKKKHNVNQRLKYQPPSNLRCNEYQVTSNSFRFIVLYRFDSSTIDTNVE